MEWSGCVLGGGHSSCTVRGCALSEAASGLVRSGRLFVKHLASRPMPWPTGAMEVDTTGVVGRADGRESDGEHARNLTGLGAEGKSGRWLSGRSRKGDSDPK